MPLLSTFTAWLAAYRLPAVFGGAFFFGESVIITTAYLTAQLHWPLATVLVAAFLGTVISDSAWFIGGRLLRKQLSRWKVLQKQRAQTHQLVQHLTGTRSFIALLFIKFLYGSRIAMIMYVAAQRVPFLTFTVFNSLGTLVWLAVIFPLGYAAGRGLSHALPLVHAMQGAVVVIVMSALVFRLLSLWLTRKLKPRQ